MKPAEAAAGRQKQPFCYLYTSEMKKIGLSLTLIGVFFCVTAFLAAIYGFKFVEMVSGPAPSSGPSLPALIQFVLDAVDTIRFHVLLIGFIGISLFIAGLALTRRARLQPGSK